MKNIDKELIEWAVTEIKTHYPLDVALLVGKTGACKIPTDEQNMSFDFFVPATEKSYALAQTFVIEDMGYDLYPISWERLEGIVAFHEPRMISVFDQSEIIYAKEEADSARFYELKEKLKENLKNEELTFTTALNYLSTAMEIWNTMMFEDSECLVRKAAGGIATYLMNAIAMVNNTYLKSGNFHLTKDMEELQMPEGFQVLYLKVLEADATTELKELSWELIKRTRDFFLERKPQKEAPQQEINYEDLAEWYYEARYTFRRIAYYAEENNREIAFLSGCYLQIEFDAIQEEFALQEMDLMGVFHREGLLPFANRAKELESYILGVLKEHVPQLKIYDSLEAFLAR